MTDKEWAAKVANEKRCIAHQIILELFEGKHTSQIQLLSMATALAHKQLDPDGYQKFVEHSAALGTKPAQAGRLKRRADQQGI
jgi:hypothetical protein